MKTNTYKNRFYRKWIKTDDFIKTQVSVEETDLQILSNKPLDRVWLEDRILNYHRNIQTYAAKDNRFLTALKPIAIESGAPKIIKHMAQASKLANVGPMAAVAGSIAQLLAEDLLREGYSEIIVENGGDIFLTKQKKTRLVAIYAGDSKFSGKLSLCIKSIQTPCGICTSSATFGHSLSFGNADGVVILAIDAALADAVATATCNLVKSSNDFKKAIAFARKVSGVFGTIIILKDNFASWGEIVINFS
jgi:ApbE superfamily uncharacterized protein (UPF0280 family)